MWNAHNKSLAPRGVWVQKKTKITLKKRIPVHEVPVEEIRVLCRGQAVELEDVEDVVKLSVRVPAHGKVTPFFLRYLRTRWGSRHAVFCCVRVCMCVFLASIDRYVRACRVRVCCACFVCVL